MKCDSGSCIQLKKETRSAKLSFVSWVIIALLPKCPLCLLSFSSAISLCGGKTIFKNAVGWTSYIPIMLAVLLITTFLINFKGKKTLMAISITLLGSIIILYGEYVTKTQITYYTGVLILLFACWVNGSFQFFFRKLKRSLNFA